MNVASGYSVRRAHSGDLGLVAQVAAETFALACPPSTPKSDIEGYVADKLSVANFAQDLATTGVAMYLAFDGEVAVGYAMLRGGQDPPVAIGFRRSVELKRIYVHESCHGKGVAELLMNACIRHARTHGYDSVWLGTNQANDRALTFYRRMGFAQVGTREFHVNNSVEDDFVLVRGLGS